MNTMKIIIPIFVFLSFYIEISAQTINRGPYLQMVTTSSIYVQWRTTTSTNSRVWYGTSPNNLNQILSSGTNVTNHSILITGLTANTTYYYAVGNSSGQMAGGDENHYFKTSPPANANQTIRAWVLGNAGNDIDDQTEVRDAFYNYIGNNHIDLMLLLGDNAYDDGTDNEYQEHWFENMYEDRLINSVMWSAYGNRDANSADSETQTGPYYNIFNFPKNAQAGGVPSGTESYYSFDYGNIHFISIDSEDDDYYELGSPMLDWLADDINSTDKPWKVAIFHHPPYTGTGNNESNTHPNETAMRENVLPIIEAAGVDLVLSSHHHSYQRSFLINGHYDVSSTWNPTTMGIDLGDGREGGDGVYFKEDDNVGTVYIVAGSAGSVASDPCCYPAMYAAEQQLGSVALEVTDLQMDVKFINENSSIEDYFTIMKGSGEPTVNITYPSNNEYFASPQTITITADATDINGTISKVEFFIDNALIGIDFAAPYSRSWTIPEGGSTYEIKVVATDNSNLTATSIVNVEVGNAICVKVNLSANDAEQSASGSVSLTSGDLELVQESTIQKVGMRFTNLNIPQGATIVSATIQFTAESTSNINPCNLNIYAQAIDNAPVFTTGSNNISNRTKTNATVLWSPANWQTTGLAGPDQKTVDISPVIQEVVNRPGYTSSSAIVIIIEGTGRRNAVSFNGSSTAAPEICVDFNLNEPLPIELLDFSAHAIGNEIKLIWSTATEENNDFFTLERSVDGRSFQKIATIPGNGTTSEVNSYDYLDKNPETGVNYYRLKQTDYNGDFSYSPIVNARISDEKYFQVYPSIVNDMITVEKGLDHHEALTVKIHDLLGKTYQVFDFPANENKKEISMKHLASGTYFLSISDDKTKESFIFFKL